MRLDTGRQNTEALDMYESMGFVDCPPYHDYPADMLPGFVFMEKSLVVGATTSSDSRERVHPAVAVDVDTARLGIGEGQQR